MAAASFLLISNSFFFFYWQAGSDPMASSHPRIYDATSEKRSSRLGEAAFLAHAQAAGGRGHWASSRPSGANSSKAKAPNVCTIVLSSMAAPFSNSSGAINRVEPHIRPTGLKKGSLW